jgi:hypothetical protein
VSRPGSPSRMKCVSHSISSGCMGRSQTAHGAPTPGPPNIRSGGRRGSLPSRTAARAFARRRVSSIGGHPRHAAVQAQIERAASGSDRENHKPDTSGPVASSVNKPVTRWKAAFSLLPQQVRRSPEPGCGAHRSISHGRRGLHRHCTRSHQRPSTEAGRSVHDRDATRHSHGAPRSVLAPKYQGRSQTPAPASQTAGQRGINPADAVASRPPRRRGQSQGGGAWRARGPGSSCPCRYPLRRGSGPAPRRSRPRGRHPRLSRRASE